MLTSPLPSLCRAGCAAALALAVLAGCASKPDVVTPPSLMYALAVAYPAKALRQGLEGKAIVELHYDAQGQVVQAHIKQSSGHPELDAAALEAAGKARLQPGTRNGRPEAGRVGLPVQFEIPKPQAPAPAPETTSAPAPEAHPFATPNQRSNTP
ncbi:energy transducer TonB [Vandammella animalimorsus]|uniref:energy transducer TonB n=1 Tax=Vandammella animalimorsus TaxID=2029117 RepID=UPI0015560D6D|nr:energy transducer TonB [Vandammella animalimorsus]